MTSDIPIAEQIAAVREPGWYLIMWGDAPRGKWHVVGGWHVAHWHLDEFWDKGPWYGNDDPYTAIMRIPDPATLQQHERDRERVAELMLRNSIATGHGDTIDDLLSELDAAIQRDRERYERTMTALLFYADERRYDYDETCCPTGRNPAGGDVLSDNGERAREAIAAIDAAVPERNKK